MHFFATRQPVANDPSATPGFSELLKSWFYDYQTVILALTIKKGGMGVR